MSESRTKVLKSASFRLRDIPTFKNIVRALDTITEEATFTISEGGLSFVGMDPSHVGLVRIDLPPSIFDLFDGPKKPIQFTLTLGDLKKLAKRMNGQDYRIDFEISEKYNEISIQGDRRRTFKLDEIEPYGAGKPIPIPQLQLDTTIRLTRKFFEDSLSDIELFADYLRISANYFEVQFTGKADGSKTIIKADKADEHILFFNNHLEFTTTTYALSYTTKMVKAVQVDSVTLEYSTNCPLRITFPLTEDGGKIEFYLAPRIEDVGGVDAQVKEGKKGWEQTTN